MRSPRLLLAVLLAVTVAAASTFTAEQAAVTMATSAGRFLASLTPEQKQKAQFAFDSPERTHWHFIPTGPAPMFPRNGLTIKEMQPSQRALAHDLLKAGLSQHGYMTATQIMDLESTLGAIEKAEVTAQGVGPRGMPPTRDPDRYFWSIFGTPDAKGTWGWRVEGHHVSLQFTVVNGAITVSAPTFFGSNPAEVREGPKKGLRVLAFEEDPARALLNELTPAQRTRAVLSADAPEDILTMNRFPIEPLAPAGVSAGELNPRQRDMLMALVDTYVAQMTSDIASLRTSQLRKAGVEKIAFAWAGGAQRGQKHYYRVQGPTFLIEYDNTQNDGNHVHSVWRDFNGDFGRDLLREHLRTAH